VSGNYQGRGREVSYYHPQTGLILPHPWLAYLPGSRWRRATLSASRPGDG
jgi:hypothetical protein